MSSVRFDAVDKMMDHPLTDLIAQLVVVHKDVAHRLSFQQLEKSRSCEDDNVHLNGTLNHSSKETIRLSRY